MAQRTDGGALGWAVRSLLLVMAVYVGSNFVHSVTVALSVVSGVEMAHAIQPATPPRTFAG